jgi:hypothetical protein
MKPQINEYYLSFLDSMMNQLEVSIPGKRRWVHTSDGGIDYSPTTRSTFPEWSKFFYVKTPIVARNEPNPYLNGYFNGNTKELTYLLSKAQSGILPRSLRLRSAFDIAISGFYDYMEEFEYQYGETYL